MEKRNRQTQKHTSPWEELGSFQHFVKIAGVIYTIAIELGTSAQLRAGWQVLSPGRHIGKDVDVVCGEDWRTRTNPFPSAAACAITTLIC